MRERDFRSTLIPACTILSVHWSGLLFLALVVAPKAHRPLEVLLRIQRTMHHPNKFSTRAQSLRPLSEFLEGILSKTCCTLTVHLIPLLLESKLIRYLS